MIVIDTNVISEMMRDTPDPHVVDWTAGGGRLHTTAITVAEVEYGIARLPAGRRQRALADAARGLFTEFDDVILPFDTRAARRYGEMVAEAEATGRPVAMADAQIAAVCASRGAVLATRNTADFEPTGVPLVDPWLGPRPGRAG